MASAGNTASSRTPEFIDLASSAGSSIFQGSRGSSSERCSGMVIADVPASFLGLDACAACVAGKAVHLLPFARVNASSTLPRQVPVN